MNKQLGTKWFTFYTKIRPWFVCFMAIPFFVDFMEYQEVYRSYWWLMIYSFAAFAQPVLSIIVFVMSRGDYEDFIRFVRGVLLFETFNISYGQAVQWYINNMLDINGALVTGVIILLFLYFVWYRLNMKYFIKRIDGMTNDYLPDNPNHVTECRSCGYRDKNLINVCPKCGQYAKQYVYLNEEPIVDTDKIRFCRKCGEKLIDNSRFCRKCGTEIVE